jgi:ATP-dependent Clp protease ATP-binding subunit ClpA
MRRVVQRAVENTVAKQMLSGQAMPGSVIEISREQVEQILGTQQQAKAIVDGEPGAQ